MTQEEKAKAYDEALERCKKWASGTWGRSVDDSPKDIAEFIFPQLAESEDERIIREIKQFILNNIGEISVDDPEYPWLAWLEKQKEQNKAEWSKEDAARLKEEIDAFNESVKDYLNSLYPQSEQKWSEEDEKIINTIVSALGQYIDYKVSGTSSVSSVYVTPRYGKEINWLKSLRPSWKPTWEQMDALKRAVHKLADTEVADSVRLSFLYDHLKELM